MSKRYALLSVSDKTGLVDLDELTGEPYTSVEGLTAAISRIATGELPPPKLWKTAAAKLNIEI